MVLYKTSRAVSVSWFMTTSHSVQFSSAWHAKGSGSLALEGRLPGLQIMGRKLQSRSNRARKRDLSQGERSVRDRARPHTLLTPKQIPFFELYAWSTRDVFHSLSGAAPCIHAT